MPRPKIIIEGELYDITVRTHFPTVSSRHSELKKILSEAKTQSIDFDCQTVQRTNKINTPLINLVVHDDTECLKLLLAEKKVNPNSHNTKGDTALTTAIKQEKLKSLQVLLNSKYQVDVNRAVNRQTPLMLAVDNINLLAVKQLIKLGAKLDLQGPTVNKRSPDNTALGQAITRKKQTASLTPTQLNDLNTIICYLAVATALQLFEEDKRTAGDAFLEKASRHAPHAAVSVLQEVTSGQFPITVSRKQRNYFDLYRLTDPEAIPVTMTLQSLLDFVSYDDGQGIHLLLSKQPFGKDDLHTALLAAVQHKKLHSLAALLDPKYQININSPDTTRETPLSLATKNFSVAELNILLRSLVKVENTAGIKLLLEQNIPNLDTTAALITAVTENKQQSIFTLLCCIRVTPSDGKALLTLAAKTNNLFAVEELIRAGIKPDDDSALRAALAVKDSQKNLDKKLKFSNSQLTDLNYIICYLAIMQALDLFENQKPVTGKTFLEIAKKQERIKTDIIFQAILNDTFLTKISDTATGILQDYVIINKKTFPLAAAVIQKTDADIEDTLLTGRYQTSSGPLQMNTSSAPRSDFFAEDSKEKRGEEQRKRLLPKERPKTNGYGAIKN